MTIYDCYRAGHPGVVFRTPRVRVYVAARWGFSACRVYGEIAIHVGRLWIGIN